MASTKGIIRSLSPPVLWQLAHKVKSRFTQSTLSFFEGPMSSWEEAVARSDGWDASVITTKTLEVALKMRDGSIEFAQDTVIRKKIVYSPTILAFLLLALSRHKDKLDIIDFGGSLGTNYFQNRKILQHLLDTPFTWNIIERPDIAKLGTEHFASSNVFFFSSLDQVLSALTGVPDSFLFSGSLQCVARPFSLLDQVISSGAKILAFDRLLVSTSDKHAVFIQHPNPKTYYPATYPGWCFSKDLFVEHLISKGFKLVEHFTLDPDAHFDHCGMVFAFDCSGSFRVHSRGFSLNAKRRHYTHGDLFKFDVPD